MLNWLRTNTGGALTEARQRAKDELAKFKNRDHMRAIVAGCAALAFADRNVSSEEKKKMYHLLQNSEELKVYSMEEVLAFFEQVVKKLEFDFDIGLSEALKVISKIKRDETIARTVVRAAIMIGGSDGNFDKNEKNIARMIAKELGLNPLDFDL